MLKAEVFLQILRVLFEHPERENLLVIEVDQAFFQHQFLILVIEFNELFECCLADLLL